MSMLNYSFSWMLILWEQARHEMLEKDSDSHRRRSNAPARHKLARVVSVLLCVRYYEQLLPLLLPMTAITALLPHNGGDISK